MTEIENTGESVEAAAQPQNEDANMHDAALAKEEMVPLSALQAERKQRQEVQQNIKMLQDHLELMRANQGNQKTEEVPNVSDDELLTVGEAKKYISNIQRKYDMTVGEMKMQQKYPDYDKVVREYLPDLLREEPELRSEIERAGNPYMLAYRLAKKSDRYQQENSKGQKNETAERILKNTQQSGSLSSVGHNAPKNEAAKPWKNMSDDEFMRYAARNLG
jgi:hypothetical protein